MSEKKHLVLLIDTTRTGCGVAIYDEGRSECLYECFVEAARGQSERLIPMIEAGFAEIDLKYANLSQILCLNGPGSFAGIRVGLSCSRALGLALGVPVYGVSTMMYVMRDCVRRYGESMNGRGVCIILESKRDDFYVSIFDADGISVVRGCYSSVQLLEMLRGDYASFAVYGDGACRFVDVLNNCDGARDVEGRVMVFHEPEIGAFCGEVVSEQGGEWLEQPEPVYYRGADVSVSKKKNRQIRED